MGGAEVGRVYNAALFLKKGGAVFSRDARVLVDRTENMFVVESQNFKKGKLDQKLGSRIKIKIKGLLFIDIFLLNLGYSVYKRLTGIRH